MFNWWHAHWRRIILQFTLWLVLGASIALAMLVTYEKRHSLRVPLAPPQTIGQLRVCLPSNWLVKSTAPAPPGGDCIEAEENTPGSEPPRKLSIERLHIDGLISPMEYLFRAGLFQEKDFSGVLREKPRVVSILMAGYPGKLITETLALSPQRGQVKKQLVACAMLPGAQALVVKLEGSGEPDAGDEELVRQMAETVGVAHVDAPPAGGGVVELADGISLDVPHNFHLLPNDDPNCISRQLLCDGSNDSWATVELISCLFFPEDGEQTLSTMLLARDGAWKPGLPRQIGSRLWRVDRADSRTFPGRAYLLANGENQAVLAVFRGGFHDSSSFDAAWATMAPSIRFIGRPDCAAMLQCGAEQAQFLAGKGLGQLLAPAGAQQWSRWDQNENLDKRDWMRVIWSSSQGSDAAVQWQGVQEQQVPYAWDKRIPYAWDKMVNHRLTWTATDDLRAYSMTAANSASDSGAADASRGELWQAFPEHALKLIDGRIQMDAPRAAGAPQPPPAQFVPGGPLPLLLGKLELDGHTALLRTDSFIGSEGPLSGLLTLIVANTTDGPAKPDETGRAMQCVSVRVNGTGRLTRLYYAAGALRYIDFAAGLHATR